MQEQMNEAGRKAVNQMKAQLSAEYEKKMEQARMHYEAKAEDAIASAKEGYERNVDGLKESNKDMVMALQQQLHESQRAAALANAMFNDRKLRVDTAVKPAAYDGDTNEDVLSRGCCAFHTPIKRK